MGIIFGKGCKFNSDSNTLTLSGSEVAWELIRAFASATEKVVFADDYNVSVGAFAFFDKLKAIDLPNGVESIGEQAFRECTSLTAVSFPDGLTLIGDAAFWGCTSITTVTLPDGLTTIGNGAFFLLHLTRRRLLPRKSHVSRRTCILWLHISSS